MQRRRSPQCVFARDVDRDVDQAQRWKRIALRLGDVAVGGPGDDDPESEDVCGLHLVTRDDRRVVLMAEQMLAVAGMSPRRSRREPASRLVETVCRLAALLHQLSVSV